MSECKHVYTMHDDCVIRCFGRGELPSNCADCGAKLADDSHACLSGEVANRYVRKLREMNALKNERLAMAVEVLELVKAQMPQGSSDKCACQRCELYDAIMPAVDTTLTTIKGV